MKNKMSFPTFKQMMTELKGLTGSNYEAGRAYTYKDGVYTFETYDGNPGVPAIAYAPSKNAKIDGFVHSHYDGIMKIYSPDDLLVAYDWKEKRNGINNINTFSYGLVTSEGKYFLMVEDRTKYYAFAEEYYENRVNLEFIFGTFGIGLNTNEEASLEGLVNLLKQLDSGLIIMKETGSNSYSKVSLDNNNNIKFINCN